MVKAPDAKKDAKDSPLELRWIPILAGAFAVLVAVGALYAVTAERGGAVAGRAESFAGLGGDFTLTANTGAPVSLSDFRGKVVLLYFGYTYCPDVCPIHLTLISAALERLGARANQVQALFVTVDPARDTPPLMDLYVSHFDAPIIGLTGSEEEIETVAAEYAVAREIVGDPAGDDYTVNHSSVIYVIGRDGEIIDLLNADVGPEELAEQLRRYL
jgi:protein SCO1/2